MQRGTRSSRPRLVAPIIAALFTVLVSTAVGAPAARAATPTTTTLEVPAGTQYGPVTVTAHVRPAPQPSAGFLPAAGILLDGSLNGVVPLDTNGDGSTQLYLPPGTFELIATFGPFGEWDASQSAPASVTVGIATQVQLSSSENPALNSEAVTITATVVPSMPGLSGGTLTIVDAFDGSTIVTGPVGGDTLSVAVTRTFATGSHALTATYSGHELYGPSTADLTQVSEADSGVLVSGLGVQYPTFYPVVDGYRDTDAIKGSLGEPAAVLIRIFSPTNALVRTANLGNRPTGAYAWAWNGRNTAGTLLAAGKYKVVQRITDGVGNVRSATSYITLSRKKLIWSTHTITKYGSQFPAYWDPGSGSVSAAKSSYSRGVRISSGTSIAGVRYTFTLRSAVVYKPLTFKVLGRSPNGTDGFAGLWNRGYGTPANAGNYDVRTVGPSYKWYSISLDSSAHRSGRTAYGEVVVAYYGGSKVFDVAKVQLTYRYAVLG